jgi:hypothetical protein
MYNTALNVYIENAKMNIVQCTPMLTNSRSTKGRRGCTLVAETQSYQSAGPVRFLIFCSISIILLANPMAGRKPQWTAGAD